MDQEPRASVDPAAPPPPGTDTPVPSDATERAAAAGRMRRREAPAAPAADRLVPAKALETRAEERARLRRERLLLQPPVGGQGVANPAAGFAPSGAMLPPGLMPAVADSMPQRLAPQQPTHGQDPHGVTPYGANPYPAPAYAAGPYGAGPYGAGPYGAGPYGAGPYGAGPYGAGPYAAAPYAAAPYAAAPYAAAPYAPVAYAAGPYPPAGPEPYPQLVLVPPRIRWTKRQRSAALLSSWVGQTLMALATHLLTAFFLIVGFAFLLHASGDEVSDFEADSFTTVVSLWSTPERVGATVVIGLLVGGGLLALGWLAQALWSKSAGLAKPHRSTWLAWLCTTATTGFIGVMVWPMALMGGLFFILGASSASLTTGTMWTTLFALLGIAIVLTGGVGLLYGWLFLSTARPRVDFAALAEAEEAAARARDEAELARVELRGEPSTR
ncbi:hypothetical protein [Agrococcus sp. UYP10]|uniref:hypothetical protein n=1 Tax=Agrococcus sp. UYP10 TaxID=1756355 RepID=UPI0033982B0C